MSQRREWEAILLQEQAVEEKQELLVEEQASNYFRPHSALNIFTKPDYDNIKHYVVGSAGTNSNSNVVTGTFLLNNRYASILFDTGADRSFISTAFSSLIDIIPTTLDHGYDDEEYTIAITSVLPTEEPDNSLSMGDEHLSTILETESDELIKSSVENLVPIPSESKDFSDIESECHVPVCDNFTTFSNHLFDADDDFSSSDDKSISDEDPDLIESMLNRDTLIISSPKFDSLLEEFLGELAHINLIPLGINEADFDPEEEIHHVEKLLYENYSPRPPEEFNSENSDAIIESFSSSPIPVEDSDSLMEEIDLFLTPDDSMPPGIENDDYDSEGDIFFLEELLSNDSPSLHENESFHFYVPSSPRPPAKPSDDGIYFEPDTGLLIAKVVGDISELYVHVPNVLPTLTNLSPMFDTLLPFSSENENKIISDFSESPMMISGGDIPILDVPIAPDFEASRAHGFVLRSLELQSLA
ncbi:zinc finger, CCHC-type containing protein [Tanacetum coccineum]